MCYNRLYVYYIGEDRRMNLTHLKYFIEIYDTQSITIASQNQFVTQPTMSLSLKKLEETLDTQLLIRSGKKYYLTEIGEVVYKEGKEILEKVDALYQRIDESMIKPEKTTVRLGLTAMYSIQFMNEISKFITSNSNVELNLIQDGSYEVQKMLANDRIDIAITSLPNFQPDKIDIDPLETTTKTKHICVLMPITNPLSKRESVTFKDLDGQRFSSLTDNFIMGRLLKERAREFGYEPNIVAYHNDLHIIMHSLITSNSICLFPYEYKAIDSPEELAWVKLDDKYSTLPIGIGKAKNKPLTEKIIEFIEILKEN